MAVNQSLQMIVSPDKSPANHELPLAVYARLWGQVSKTCSMLKESSGELLELSVLVPAAPWVSSIHTWGQLLWNWNSNSGIGVLFLKVIGIGEI